MPENLDQKLDYNPFKQKDRMPNKIDSFNLIRYLKIPIETIIDVGVLSQTHELTTCFYDKTHILFEPVPEFQDNINSVYTKKGIKYKLFNMAVSDFDGDSYLETRSIREGRPITHSRIVEKQSNKSLIVKTARLDTIMPTLSCEKPYLLKIDVDGIDLKVLEGASKILDFCNIIVIEANISNIAERMNCVISKGFSLFDIVDFCYYDNILRQVDLIFLNTKTKNDLNLDFYKQNFDIKKWRAYKLKQQMLLKPTATEVAAKKLFFY